MLNQYSRTQLIFGAEAMEKLRNSRVAVFGIGGGEFFTRIMHNFAGDEEMRKFSCNRGKIMVN